MLVAVSLLHIISLLTQLLRTCVMCVMRTTPMTNVSMIKIRQTTYINNRSPIQCLIRNSDCLAIINRYSANQNYRGQHWFFSLPEQLWWRANVLPLASASTNVNLFIKVFKTSLFPNVITDLIHLWYDYTYWSKILRSTIPTTLDHVKVKVSDLKFSCKILGPHYFFIWLTSTSSGELSCVATGLVYYYYYYFQKKINGSVFHVNHPASKWFTWNAVFFFFFFFKVIKTRGPWWPCNAHLSIIAFREPDLELIKANILTKIHDDNINK